MKRLTKEERKTIKYLPCPFCGGHAMPMAAVGEFWVMCDICHASIGMCNTEYQAVEEWNRRYVPASGNLIEDIKSAQVEAGERAVMENLKRMGF